MQSHSKIQLRISTIREAFPDENFPITSTKRRRERSKTPKDEAMSSDDEHVAPVTAHVAVSSNGASFGSTITKAPLTPGDSGLLKNVEDEGSAKGSGASRAPALEIFASPNRASSPTETPSIRSEVVGVSASSPTSPSANAVYLAQIQSNQEQIRKQHQKHQQLLFDIFFHNQPLSPSAMAETVQAHCAANYDAVSRELQARSGSTFDKVILPNG